MTNFKIGDKIRIVGRPNTIEEKKRFIGEEVEIRDFQGYDMVNTTPVLGNWAWYYDEIELVEEKFTKKDLKTGMLLVRRDGVIRKVLLNTPNGDIGIGEQEDYLCLDGYNQDLTHSKYDDWDVMKVYSFNYQHMTLIFDLKGAKLIWEREVPVPIKELSVEEIQNILGYKIKIVE